MARRRADRWAVLVAEVMLQQTQVARVEQMWGPFLARFPDPDTAAAAGRGRADRRVGPARLPAPGPPAVGGRIARRTTRAGPPISPSCRASAATPRARSRPKPTRPTRSRSTRTSGASSNASRAALLGQRDAEEARAAARRNALGTGPTPRAHGSRRARVHEAETPPAAPAHCSAGVRRAGPLADERRSHQAPFAGSFRQRRGRVLAALRARPTPVTQLDAEALASLVVDGLAEVHGPTAALPS